jgi:Rrf2 family protein
MDIPDQFLSKIAPQLAKAQIIEIIQGARGGYRLIISPDKLTMLDVVEAVIGEIFLNDCVLRPEACQRAPACSAHQVWEKARNQLRDTLRETSFQQMLADETCGTDQLKTPR